MLTPEGEKRAAEVFEELFDFDPADRELALASRALNEPDIAARVRQLFASVVDLDGPEPPPSKGLPEPGDVFGPYRIDTRIGEGGYGVVFRATREIGESRSPVAIKFLDMVVASEEMRNRFDFERQILAELDHPGIARMLDGGATPAGLPYLVMEFVEGEPIDEYCDTRKLGVTQRLELFLQVAAALEYAHRRQVLHRDIKPRNILVDPQGHVKVLDFGIAKLLTPRPGAAPLSRAGQRLFTPSHSSPEQLGGAAQTVGADIYSLGVVLYQLLCGHLPFENLSWDPVEALAARQRQPPAPSKAIYLADAEQQGNTSARISDRRSTRSRHLQRILDGDLDAIVLTALRTLPSERYSSIDALRLDIERFLGGNPVEARPLSVTTRVLKWMRRNPVATALLALAFCTMIWGFCSSFPSFAANKRAMEATSDDLAFTRYVLSKRLALIRIKLESSSGSGPAVDALVKEQIRFTKTVDAWPVELRAEVERDLYLSYAQAGESQWFLGHREEAVSLLGTAIDGFASLYSLFPADRELKSLYVRGLRQRLHFRTLLGRKAAAAADRARLVELEGAYGRAPE